MNGNICGHFNIRPSIYFILLLLALSFKAGNNKEFMLSWHCYLYFSV